MASSATVTAKIGPGAQATSLALADIVDFGFDCDKNVCFIKLRNGSVKYFAGYSTITVTVSSGNYTLTLS
jgi:hypothetical protein